MSVIMHVSRETVHREVGMFVYRVTWWTAWVTLLNIVWYITG